MERHWEGHAIVKLGLNGLYSQNYKDEDSFIQQIFTNNGSRFDYISAFIPPPCIHLSTSHSTWKTET